MMNLLLRYRMVLIVPFTGVLVALALWAAYAARFDGAIPGEYQLALLRLLPPALALKLGAFWWRGVFRGWWRYVSVDDVIQLFKANAVASVAVTLFAVFVLRLEGIPRSVLILDPLFCFAAVAGVRFLTRAFRENYLPWSFLTARDCKRVLVVGAGAVGQTIVREIRQNTRLKKVVLGFVDPDPERQRSSFEGVPVLATPEALGRLCTELRIDLVIVAYTASAEQLRQVVADCQSVGVESKIVPRMGDILTGRVSIQRIRNVEVEDLLGRAPVRLDEAAIRSYLSGRRILVTGAGGSIGSELCRQVAAFSPGALVLLDSAETPLFHIERELAAEHPGQQLVPVLADIKDAAKVAAVFGQAQPDVVFHAAAYKHVPMLEHNPEAAVFNNVHGTRVLADAADRCGVERFVMVSTDKAVHPTSVMGVSKRTAELYVQSLAQRSRTHFVTVRFGNVLGSNGSVVPIFREQIRSGGPVTVTHAAMTRFFMTIPEASQLVLQAGSMGNGGEIFLLDMGQPVRIVELAEQMIRLSGLEPHEDIAIEFTGTRPGEKLEEELLLDAEGVLPTAHEKIRVARAAQGDRAALAKGLDELLQYAEAMDAARVRRAFARLVPEFRGGEMGPAAAPKEGAKPAAAAVDGAATPGMVLPAAEPGG